MRYLLLSLFTLFIFSCGNSGSLSDTEKEGIVEEIVLLMQEQEDCWNAGDLECFMKHYWKSDDLMFVGSNIAYGWQKTLDNYKKSYPDRTAMGKLKFTNIQIEPAGRENCFVLGQWNLEREDGNLGGHYSLFWKKNEGGEWVICIDHSS